MKKLMGYLGILLREHKLKFLTAFASFLIFLFFFFPFNDLGDLVANQINQVAPGQLSVTFDNFDISLFPRPGAQMTKVTVETSMTAPINIDRLIVLPNIVAALTFKKGVSANAQGVFGGDASFSFRETEKTKDGKTRKQKISIDLDSVSIDGALKVLEDGLPGISDYLRLISGKLMGDVDLEMDPTLTEQPVGKFSLSGKNVKLNDGLLNIQGFPINVPGMDLKTMSLDAGLDKGVLTISKAQLGATGSDLNISATGRVGVRMTPAGGMSPSNYDLNIRLVVGPTAQAKLGTYLPLLGGYKIADNTFSLHIAAADLYSMPTINKGQ